MTKLFYHGTRKVSKTGDLVQPGEDERQGSANHVFLSTNLDEAVWEAEIGPGDGSGRVYIVEPTGEIEDAAAVRDLKGGQLLMSCCSHDPLRVIREVTEWPLYHGTRAALSPGDLIKPGHRPNFGNNLRTATYVYMSRTLNAAIWGAELAAGEGRGRIYIIEPTGPIEEDPNLTDKKFRGNPTKSFRSKSPLRITGEITDWQGHSPEALQAMRDGLERLKQMGIEPNDD